MKAAVLILASVLVFLPCGAKEAAGTLSRQTGKLAVGTKWETDWHIVDSGREGPTVLIVGGMHGNEPAGSLAAGQILHWPVEKGKLVVVPRANVLALDANKRLTPGASKEISNLNRNFPPVDESTVGKVEPQGELARALWQFAMKTKPDWVLDLHEGYDFFRSHQPPKGKDKSVGSSIIYRGGKKMDDLVAKAIAAADTTVTDPARKFSLIRRGPVSTGLARACINVMGAEGVILETTYKEQPMSLRTRQHRLMVNVFLNHIGLIDRDCSDLLAAPKSGDTLQVGCFDGEGTGPSKNDVMGVVDDAEDLALFHLGAEDMRAEVLKQFDVVIFPGGSGSKQARDIGEKGRAAVRNFVEGGGGYVGICAGAYLCSANYSWSLDLVDTRALTGTVEVPGEGKKQLWYRGGDAFIETELTEKGVRLFGSGGIPKQFTVRYHNGPIVTPHGSGELEDYEVLAWFRGENGRLEAQKGTMVNTPAIVSGSFGKGRAVSISPHPESNPDLHPVIAQAVRYAAGWVK